jgi:enterochelin esterase family protein
MTTHISPNVRFVQHTSEVLRGNPLRDRHARDFPIWLPPDYDSSPNKRYPVIFGLAGFTGRGVNYLNRRFMFPAHDELLDELAAGGTPGVIYVMPDCLTRLGGSQYVNSSAVGRYDDYIVRELVPFIDETFRTTGRHAVMGGSSGGIGAFTLAAKHPDVFQAFADHSGDSAFDSCYLNDIPRFVQAMERYNYSVEEFVRQIPDIQPKDDSFDIILNLVAMSACYAPNPDAPLGFELPFDPYSGALRPDVWAKFRQHDPVQMVEPYQDNLRRLRLAFIDCGKKDQFHLFLGARQLHQKLDAFVITHVFEEYDSDHFLLRREQKRKTIPMLVETLSS